MAHKLNLEFGGTIPVTAPGQLGTLATAYENLADTHGLVTLGFDALLPDRENITGVQVSYRKEGLAEGTLGGFQTWWRGIIDANSITPTETTIEHYEE